MDNYLIVSSKPWNDRLADRLAQRTSFDWIQIRSKNEFTFERLQELKPEKVFIPHWSHIIPKEIYENFECIVFHMTDVPYGRGGSPLQNLIKRGHDQTQLSALRVGQEMDAGNVYLKNPLSLLGTAEEIFIRADKIIEDMIVEIIEKNLMAKPQQGRVVEFRRRSPKESTIEELKGLKELYDHIRMLDAKGYPRAFLETEHFRFEFKRASLKTDKMVANVRIFEK